MRCGRKREDTYSALRFGFEFRVSGFVVYYLLSYFAVENGCYGLFWVLTTFLFCFRIGHNKQRLGVFALLISLQI